MSNDTKHVHVREMPVRCCVSRRKSYIKYCTQRNFSIKLINKIEDKWTKSPVQLVLNINNKEKNATSTWGPQFEKSSFSGAKREAKQKVLQYMWGSAKNLCIYSIISIIELCGEYKRKNDEFSTALNRLLLLMFISENGRAPELYNFWCKTWEGYIQNSICREETIFDIRILVYHWNTQFISKYNYVSEYI